MLEVLHELWTLSVYFKFIINIPSGDMRLCEKIISFTWFHNHSSWQRAVYGGHPSAMDTFPSPVSLQCYLTLVSWTKCKYIFFVEMKEKYFYIVIQLDIHISAIYEPLLWRLKGLTIFTFFSPPNDSCITITSIKHGVKHLNSGWLLLSTKNVKHIDNLFIITVV